MVLGLEMQWKHIACPQKTDGVGEAEKIGLQPLRTSFSDGTAQWAMEHIDGL